MFANLAATMKRFWRDESGPTATEYAAMLGVIAGGAIFAMSSFGDGVNAIYVALDGAVQVGDT